MVPLSQGANLADPAWSPDGKTVAVTSYTLGSPRLLLVPTDGRASVPLATPDGEAYRASYSPDGAWLVYTLRHEGKNDLHAIQTSGARRDVALTSDGASWNGVFSPDGKQMAFLREKDGVIDLVRDGSRRCPLWRIGEDRREADAWGGDRRREPACLGSLAKPSRGARRAASVFALRRSP